MGYRTQGICQILQKVFKSSEIKELTNFFFFVKGKSDWKQYGILIVPHYNGTTITINIVPNSEADTIKFDSIVKIYGADSFDINSSWLGIAAAYRQVFKLHKICVKVNSMKVFL